MLAGSFGAATRGRRWWEDEGTRNDEGKEEKSSRHCLGICCGFICFAWLSEIPWRWSLAVAANQCETLSLSLLLTRSFPTSAAIPPSIFLGRASSDFCSLRDFAFYAHNLTCAPWLKPTMMKIISVSPVSIEGFPASLIGLFENIGIILTAGMTFRSRRKKCVSFWFVCLHFGRYRNYDILHVYFVVSSSCSWETPCGELPSRRVYTF